MAIFQREGNTLSDAQVGGYRTYFLDGLAGDQMLKENQLGYYCLPTPTCLQESPLILAILQLLIHS